MCILITYITFCPPNAYTYLLQFSSRGSQIGPIFTTEWAYLEKYIGIALLKLDNSTVVQKRGKNDFLEILRSYPLNLLHAMRNTSCENFIRIG